MLSHCETHPYTHCYNERTNEQRPQRGLCDKVLPEARPAPLN